MQPSSENVYFFISTLQRNNYKASQIHSLLVEAWGQDNVPSLRRVQDISKEFASGERENCTRSQGSGRMKDVRTAENIAAVRDLVENDETISINAISQITGITWSSVQRILTDDLHKQSVCARWVPHKLSQAQMNMRVEGAQRILNELEGNVIVIDEKWLYSEPMPPKENVRAWVDPGGDRPRIARRIIADRKFHIIVAMNFRCDFCFDIVEPGQTVNAHRYVQFLEKVNGLRRRGTLKIMHDNARPHTARMTEAFLAEHSIHRVPQPPYSPDVNLMDRYIFRNMEAARKDKTFNNPQEVRDFLQEYLSQQTRYKLSREMDRLREDLHSIILCGGDYL